MGKLVGVDGSDMQSPSVDKIVDKIVERLSPSSDKSVTEVTGGASSRVVGDKDVKAHLISVGMSEAGAHAMGELAAELYPLVGKPTRYNKVKRKFMKANPDIVREYTELRLNYDVLPQVVEDTDNDVVGIYTPELTQGPRVATLKKERLVGGHSRIEKEKQEHKVPDIGRGRYM